MNIDLMRALSREVNVNKKLNKDISSEVKSDKSFKDVLDNKTKESTVDNSKEVSEEVTKVEDKPMELIEDISEKINSLNDKIESGLNEGEIPEELVQILGLLNVIITESNTLPILVNMESFDEVMKVETDSIIVPKVTLDMDLEVELINQAQVITNSDITTEVAFKDIILQALGQEANTIEPEVLEKLEKQISNIVPLIKSDKGEDINKDHIITALKNKLNELTSKATNTENTTVKEASVKVEAIPTMVVREENVINVHNNSSLSAEALTEEDKVLNKLLGEDTKSFSGILSRFEAKNTVMNSGTIEGTPVFKQTMDNDIIKNVKFMIRNEIQELKVKIYPKELGELTIKILSEEGIMRAEIKATSKETYNLLNSNMNEIKKVLSNENIKIQEVNIGLYSEDTTYFSGQGFQGRANDNREQRSNSTMVVNNEGEEIIEEVNNISNLDLLA